MSPAPPENAVRGDGKAWFNAPTNAFWRWHKDSGLGELTPEQKEASEEWLAEEPDRESETVKLAAGNIT